MSRDLMTLLNVRRAPATNFMQISTPPWPEGMIRPDASNLLRIKTLVIKGFKTADVFSLSDHWLLKHDVAEILGLGTDVKRLYSARAYRFNQWGVRSA